eukprot:9419870-Lingulodinium_polyedra.AAC.1
MTCLSSHEQHAAWPRLGRRPGSQGGCPEPPTPPPAHGRAGPLGDGQLPARTGLAAAMGGQRLGGRGGTAAAGGDHGRRSVCGCGRLHVLLAAATAATTLAGEPSAATGGGEGQEARGAATAHAEAARA